MSPSEYNNLAEQLIGETLASINCFQLDSPNSENYWNTCSEFHTLDFGLDLIFESGKVYSLAWGDHFYQFDLQIKPFSISNEIAAFKKIDLTTNKNWSIYIGKCINDARPIWSNITKSYGANKSHGILGLKQKFVNTHPDRTISFPETIVINFNNQKSLYISAVEIQDKKANLHADSITVFFKEDVASQYIDIIGNN